MRQLNSIVTSKIQFVKSNKDILIIGARLKYALLLFFALFTKMNKNVNYAYQYLSNTETKNKIRERFNEKSKNWKMWYAILDVKTCRDCRKKHGSIYQMNETPNPKPPLHFSCKYLGEIHKRLKESFEFPEYYGENLSALWDCLRFYSFEKTIIVVEGTEKVANELKDDMLDVLRIFDRVHNENPAIEFQILS